MLWPSELLASRPANLAPCVPGDAIAFPGVDYGSHRDYAAPRTREWLCVSVGQSDEMRAFLTCAKRILQELC